MESKNIRVAASQFFEGFSQSLNYLNENNLQTIIDSFFVAPNTEVTNDLRLNESEPEVLEIQNYLQKLLTFNNFGYSLKEGINNTPNIKNESDDSFNISLKAKVETDYLADTLKVKNKLPVLVNLKFRKENQELMGLKITGINSNGPKTQILSTFTDTSGGFTPTPMDEMAFRVFRDSAKQKVAQFFSIISSHAYYQNQDTSILLNLFMNNGKDIEIQVSSLNRNRKQTLSIGEYLNHLDQLEYTNKDISLGEDFTYVDKSFTPIEKGKSWSGLIRFEQLFQGKGRSRYRDSTLKDVLCYILKEGNEYNLYLGNVEVRTTKDFPFIRP